MFLCIYNTFLSVWSPFSGLVQQQLLSIRWGISANLKIFGFRRIRTMDLSHQSWQSKLTLQTTKPPLFVTIFDKSWNNLQSSQSYYCFYLILTKDAGIYNLFSQSLPWFADIFHSLKYLSFVLFLFNQQPRCHQCVLI